MRIHFVRLRSGGSIVLLAACIGCSAPDGSSTAISRFDLLGTEDPDPLANTVFSVTMMNDRVVSSSTKIIASDVNGAAVAQVAEGVPSITPTAGSKLDESLSDSLQRAEASGDGSKTVDVVVTLVEGLRIPRFPSPDLTQPRDSLANQAVLQRNQEIIAAIEQARAPAYSELAIDLSQNYAATVKSVFWLINAVNLEIPLSRLRALSARGDVLYIEENEKPIPPPNGTILNARNLMQTEPYFNQPQPTSWIGIVDTGVRSTHTLISSNLGFFRDCVNGWFNNCADRGPTFLTSPLDPSDNFWNHGTHTFSVISGNANLGNDNRGITSIVVDSFKAYTNSGTNLSGGIRGFQAAIASSDRIIAGEWQDTGADNAGIAAAADAAFDAGAVVVAAAGNYGPAAGSVRSPGKAAKVLAVGNVDVMTQTLDSTSGRGPTAGDRRVKPDITSASNLTSASNASDSALSFFTGTSCATASATGVAAQVRNFLRSSSGSPFEFSPATVYAFMIMSGTNFSNPAQDNNLGAGLPILPSPTASSFTWGNVNITQAQTIDIDVFVGTASNVDAALWWPEPPNQTHSDIDLFLIRPNGSQAGFSSSVDGIFEKVRASPPLTSGIWKLRILGFNLSGTQAVHFALAVH